MKKWHGLKSQRDYSYDCCLIWYNGVYKCEKEAMEIRREIKKENRGGNLVSKEKKQCKAQKTEQKRKKYKRIAKARSCVVICSLNTVNVTLHILYEL